MTNAQSYLAVDGGAMFQQNATLRQTALPDTKATFNTGARGDLDLGYNFSPCAAAELEGGFMWNSIDKVFGQPLSLSHQSADLYSIPILLNFFVKIPTHTPVIPYFGIGGGGNVSIIKFKDNGEDFTESDVEPAVQGEAGLRFMLCRNASLGVGYKFMATLAQRYDFRSIDDHLSLAGIYTHTVFLDFKVNF
jgi:opacity protein-like surface antigen